jgi:holo-[acyl-carrier protein] synthase
MGASWNMRVGADVIEINRIEGALKRFPGFAGRILTKAELQVAASRRDPTSFVAGRFAAKEAISKALGGGFGWQEVEILPDGDGAPVVMLSGKARDAGDGVELCLSISHSRTVATAVAIATLESR